MDRPKLVVIPESHGGGSAEPRRLEGAQRNSVHPRHRIVNTVSHPCAGPVYARAMTVNRIQLLKHVDRIRRPPAWFEDWDL